MGHIPPLPPNWRLEAGFSYIIKYKRRFALWPAKCLDGTTIWFNFYYKKYELWLVDEYRDSHTDFIGNLSEADFIIEKLIGND